MPKTRAGRGTALKNSILAQAWFLVENQTPADIEQMMESWRKEAWSFYGNHNSRLYFCSFILDLCSEFYFVLLLLRRIVIYEKCIIALSLGTYR